MRWMTTGLGLALLAASASALADQTRCFVSVGEAKPIRLSFTVFDQEQGEYEAGRVRYAGQPHSIPIVFKHSEAPAAEENRPDELISTWLEILPAEERISGRYQIYHRGSQITGFSYTHYRSVKRFEFQEHPEAQDEKGACRW
ncbi:hypothetical protein ACX0MV_00690 [Pseudomonas borbori]